MMPLSRAGLALAGGFALLALGACARSPRSAKPPAEPFAACPTAAAPSGTRPPPTPTPTHDAFLEWGNLPGCTRDDAKATKDALGRIDAALSGRTKTDLHTIVGDLDGAWASPCLAHVARFFPRPEISTTAELRDLWYRGLRGVVAFIGGFYIRDGKRFFYAPPTRPRPLGAEEERALAPWICGPKQSCGNVGTFIARAESVFDAAELSRRSRHEKDGWAICTGATSPDEAAPKLTAFEVWGRCVAYEIPHSEHYSSSPSSPRLRGPERGWLVLRGRRGHYTFADEVRAYDLTTGAAYVSRSESGLVLDGPGVDFAATDAKRRPEAFTGNVLPEAVRELAFVALTGSALVPVRSEMTIVPVPKEIALELSPQASGFAFDIEPSGWSSSAQTELSFTITDGAKLVADGHFTWPNSSSPGEQRADEVVVALEAGLEKGCPRAALPLRYGRSVSSGASSIDADPARQVGVASDLDRALESLRSNRCP